MARASLFVNPVVKETIGLAENYCQESGSSGDHLDFTLAEGVKRSVVWERNENSCCILMVEKESGLASGGTPETGLTVVLQTVQGWQLSQLEWSVTGLTLELEGEWLHPMEWTEHWTPQTGRSSEGHSLLVTAWREESLRKSPSIQVPTCWPAQWTGPVAVSDSAWTTLGANFQEQHLEASKTGMGTGYQLHFSRSALISTVLLSTCWDPVHDY